MQEMRQAKKPRATQKRSLASLLFEDEEIGAAAEVPKFTLVALYGPPAAGKGAAKKFVKSEFGGEAQTATIDKWLEDLPDDAKDSAKKEIKGVIEKEEDAWMTSITTGKFPAAIFKDLHDQAQGEEGAWNSAAEEYWHQKETGPIRKIKELIDGKTYVKIMEENNWDVDKTAQQFANFPETQSWFAQARGFSKAPPGMEEFESYMGPIQDGPYEGRTVKLRQAAADDYINKVNDSIEKMMGNAQKFGHLFLADQAGESTVNKARMDQLATLRDKGVRVIGVYIHQPQARTTIANLHRKSMDMGGRRVAQSEVDKISGAGPEFDDDGNFTEPGDTLKHMEGLFDGVYLYHPGKSFEFEETSQGLGPDGTATQVPIASSICEPLGDGTGILDIEGCDDENVHPGQKGPEVEAGSLRGLEAKISKKSGVADEEGTGYLPKFEDLSGEDIQAVLGALRDYGFQNIGEKNLEGYLSMYAPGGAQRSPSFGDKKDFGNNPYGKALFGDMSADQKEVIKDPKKNECALAKYAKGDLIMERWRKMAGII